MLRPRFTWNLGQRRLSLGERSLVMGVVNVTPDSFSDGGQFLSPEAAIAHGLRLLDEGADILDIGGESTRPGATPLSVDEELSRILPVIEALRHARPDSVLSVDTYKSEVARRAIASGADIVNDVSGLLWDPAMAATLASLSCGAILMHTRGRPDEWRSLPKLDDPLALVLTELRQIADAALAAGLAQDRLVLDPGFGFGKRFDENYPILAHFDRLHSLGFPLLSGPSRKSFLARTVSRRLVETGFSSNGYEPEGAPFKPDVGLSGDVDVPPRYETPSDRLPATLAAVTASVLKGAHIVRVHDVRPTVEAVALADAILRSSL
jgi:dihydropteroate synthase